MYRNISSDKCSTCLLCTSIVTRWNVGLNVARILRRSASKPFLFQPFYGNFNQSTTANIVNINLGCAFSRSRWWIITFRVHSPPKPPFWGLNRHFKPNMRKIQIAISSDMCITLTWNLTSSCDQQRLRGWSRMVVKQNQDGGRPPFWKSLYRHISPNKKLCCRKEAARCFVSV